ncbi:MAG TPA: alpha/beta hydrolase [Terriglobia bacterium]|nr:alpha/beta hydrolase [Terriglobia bacterium]
MARPEIKTIRTAELEIAYETAGPAEGAPVILMHGFPDDPRIWDEAMAMLARSGYRCYAPYLRGYGPTRFLSATTMRSGQQAALGHDLKSFMTALGIERAVLVGYDWGGRACCIVAALWPEMVERLVTITGYNIQNIARALEPDVPDVEHRFWYQWYFNTERGRIGLARNRRAISRRLWELWSPNWKFDDETFEATAISFDNPDFVDIVIHSYRHRFQNAPGDPALEPIEVKLAGQPKIGVPTVVLHGACDGVDLEYFSHDHRRHFTGPYLRRVVPLAGHFLPREATDAVLQAVAEEIS